MHVSTGPSRSVPGYACPFTEQTEHIQKRARLQPVGCYFMLTPDLGYAPRFLAVFSALSFFRFDGESCPTHLPLTPAVRRLPSKLQEIDHSFWLVKFSRNLLKTFNQNAILLVKEITMSAVGVVSLIIRPDSILGLSSTSNKSP
jgi:hypothetical protein